MDLISNNLVSNPKILYYCFGGGLDHLTRFFAFCNTTGIRPVLITAKDKLDKALLDCFTSGVYILPHNLISDKEGVRNWICEIIHRMRPDRFIVDAFPGGILGELVNCSELEDVKIEYIARIVKLDVYCKRLNGCLPKISKIWQVEELGEEQSLWLNKLAVENNTCVEKLDLKYPDFYNDSSFSLPQNCWLIVHSGCEKEVLELYEYAKEVAMVENISPNIVLVGQIARPEFLPNNIPYYSVYPVFNLLKKASRVFSGAGFNIMKQMSLMCDKHYVLPFNRPLDDQYLRLKLKRDER